MPEYGFSLTHIFRKRTESEILLLYGKCRSGKTFILAYFTPCAMNVFMTVAGQVKAGIFENYHEW